MRRSHSLIALLALSTASRADNWPMWRGPTGQGTSAEKNLPVQWSTTENVKWKVPLPDEGNSTPVIWGDKVFLTQATDKTTWPPKGNNGGPASAETRMLLCLSRSDGMELWRKEVTYKELESTHRTNPFCSASPATDGERVVVSHGSAGVFCYDLGGKELWRRDLGKCEHIWGNASSPIIYRDLAIVNFGPGEQLVGGQPELFNAVGTEVFDQHVAPGEQVVADPAAVGVPHVEGDGPLAAVAGEEVRGERPEKRRPPAAGVVAGTGAFELDDVGAEVGE